MNSTTLLRHKLTIFSAVALLSSTALAYDFNNAPAPSLTEKQQGEIVYVTGGIGEEESMALEAVRSEYNVHIMSSSKDGEFSGNTAIVIYDRKGNEVLAADSGPLFYTNLPAGKYKVMAENNGMEQTKTLNVSAKKSSDVHLIWN